MPALGAESYVFQGREHSSGAVFESLNVGTSNHEITDTMVIRLFHVGFKRSAIVGRGEKRRGLLVQSILLIITDFRLGTLF